MTPFKIYHSKIWQVWPFEGQVKGKPILRGHRCQTLEKDIFLKDFNMHVFSC